MRKAFLAVALSLAIGAGCDRAEPATVQDVRLGMSPRDVRERFDPGGGAKNESGAWQTRMGDGGDSIAEWRSGDASSSVETARFEFHLGMLVAVRVHYRGGPSALGGAAIVVTPKTVLERSASIHGADVTLLARDCPTHHDEAEALVSRAR